MSDRWLLGRQKECSVAVLIVSTANPILLKVIVKNS